MGDGAAINALAFSGGGTLPSYHPCTGLAFSGGGTRLATLTPTLTLTLAFSGGGTRLATLTLTLTLTH